MCGENTNIMTMPGTTDNYAHVAIYNIHVCTTLAVKVNRGNSDHRVIPITAVYHRSVAL